MSYPDAFPGSWQDIPLDVRRCLTARLLKKQLELQGGPAGLLAWLYRGDDRLAPNVKWTAKPSECWALVLADTEDWLASRRAGGVTA